MNQVFITRSVDRERPTCRSDFRDLINIGAHMVGGAAGGAVVAAALAALGLASRAMPLTNVAVAVVALGIAFASIILQVAGKVEPLPQRRGQVPRHWLGWRRKWLTATAYGFLLGGGGFTPLRQASMYALAAMALWAPSISFGAAVGAIYGLNRAGTVLAQWSLRRLGSAHVLELSNRATLLLALLALGAPYWVARQLHG